MGQLALPLAIAAVGLQTIGMIQQGRAAKAAGEAQGRAMEHRAAMGRMAALAKDQQAGQERAAAQRRLLGERKREARVGSRIQALSAASGGGALDPTIIDILGDVGAEGEFRAMSALYEGEERARGLEFGASIDRAGAEGDIFAGEAARRAGRTARNIAFLKAGATLAKGGLSLYDKYGGGGPGGGGPGDPFDDRNWGFA